MTPAALHLSPLAVAGCALAGYALMMFTNPARAGFRDGLRALRRYPSLWAIPGVFGFSAAIFQLLKRAYFAWVLPPSERQGFYWMREAWSDKDYWLTGSDQSVWWLPREEFLHALRESRMPAFETLAGMFNCLVAAFPISAMAAILLLLNRGGHHGVLIRALRKRLGIFGWAVHFGIVVCAVAAIAKPLLYIAPQLFALTADSADLWQQWSQVIAWLSFLFEYLCGVFIQTYLILLAYIWVRGLTFTRTHLVDFSMRRFSAVVKWAGIVMLFSTLFIELPLVLRNFGSFAGWFPEPEQFAMRLTAARAALAIFSLLAASMQITLIFHSESLVAAFRDHVAFLREHWWPLAWFIAIAGLHCFAMQAGRQAVAFGLGEGSALWVAWSLLSPWIAGVIVAWMLASWVCIFKRCATPAQSAATQTMFRF